MINKQDVIQMLDDYIERLNDTVTGEVTETILRIVREKVEDIPDQGEWIPAELEVPEDKTVVLATVRHDRWICDYERDEDEWTVHPEYHEVCSIYRDGNEYIKMDDSDFDNITYIPVGEQEKDIAYPIEVVTAWMPLPPAYKGE